MKQTRTISSLTAICIAAAVMTATACTKENAARFEGEYSFATSGTLTAVPSDPSQGTDTVIFKTANEHGQMNILKKDKSKNDMVITMNIIGGDAVVFGNVTASGKILRLTEPYTSRKIQISDGLLPANAEVTVSGTAEKFNDVVMFRLEYDGTVTSGSKEYTVIDSSIDCIAKEND